MLPFVMESGPFYDASSPTRIILIRTASNIFIILSTKMSFSSTNIVYIVILLQGSLPFVCEVLPLLLTKVFLNGTLRNLDTMLNIKNVLLKFKNGPKHPITSRDFALCSKNMSFLTLFEKICEFCNSGTIVNPGHISSS